MPKFLRNFFGTNYFKVYLISIFFFSVIFLSQKFLHPTDWTTSEWLINYQGGFVRRGLIGEIIFQIYLLSDVPLRFLIFYFEILLLLIYLVLIYRFFQKIYLNELLIFLFFSPIFLLYPLAENEVLIRKEYLLFCIYIIYLNLILNNNKLYFLVNIIFLPLMCLIWDGMIFYIYFFIFSFICKKNLNNKEIFYAILSFFPYLISLYFVISAKSNPIGFDQMCISINEKCFGAMLALDKTLMWNIRYVSTRFEYDYFLRHFLIIILCFSPIIIFSYFDKYKLSIGNILIKKILLKLNLLLIISILVFMLVGYDWGRWINIGYFFSLITIIFLIKNNNINFYDNYICKLLQKFSNNKQKIFYLIFFFYTFSWNMKVIMTDDIGSLPYYRIITKTIKIIGLQS